MKNLATATWVEHPDNPLIQPPSPHWLIGDPSVLTPAQTPDGRWHMFANSVGFIVHYVGDDGVKWSRVGHNQFRGVRAFVFMEEGKYHLFYELHKATLHRSAIMVRTSSDLQAWSEPTLVLEPSLPWDGRTVRHTACPCVVKVGDTYRLYFSSNAVWLWDTLVFEPTHVGVAESKSLTGPYVRRPEPLLAPDPTHPYRNQGAGSMKLYPREGGGFWVLHNGIYKDAAGKSHSAIMLMTSPDGYQLEYAHREPIVAPGGEGWRRAFCYAFSLVEHAGEVRLYFNARDGWIRAKEYIGFVRAVWA